MTPTALIQHAECGFGAVFGVAARVVAYAPGRVELLGNHTDYNGGLVMSAAVDRHTVALGARRSDRMARVHALDLDASDAFALDSITPGDAGGWSRYVRGVCWVLQERFGALADGFDMLIAGNVPRGAGLSSSASLEAAVAWCLLGLGLVEGAEAVPEEGARFELARMLQRAENEFAGVACGLLDQFSSVFGGADQALVLDCARGTFGRVPLVGRAGEPPPAIVVCDTRTSRSLADGMYNQRREECERVVRYFQGLRGAEQVRWLGDIRLDELEAEWDALDSVGRRRARHVITENERVGAGERALRAGELERFGELMSASHRSSRDDFENSSPALDAMIEAAREAPGFLGGKLSGGGWAGCTVNLVRGDCAGAFATQVRLGYVRRMGKEADVHVCRAAAGAAWGSRI